LHIANGFARLGTIFANVGALSTDMRMMLGTTQHEIGAGRTNLGAVHHQAKVLGRHMSAAHFQAVSRGHAQTSGVTGLTILDALLHLSRKMFHR
jgi:hypothetical protein